MSGPAIEDERMTTDPTEATGPGDGGRLRTTLRMPPGQYEAVRDLAARDERSLNWALCKLVKLGLEASEAGRPEPTRPLDRRA